MKYRIYYFDRGELIFVGQMDKLPKDARKHGNVWTTPDIHGLWTKLCLSLSDIDFGTGVTTPSEREQE